MKEKASEIIKTVIAILVLLCLVAAVGFGVWYAVREIEENRNSDFDIETVPTPEMSEDMTSVSSVCVEEPVPPVPPVPEVNGKVPTIKSLLEAALEPIGSTLYVYGGGWNEADTGAGEETMSYGLSDEWKVFFEKNKSGYKSSKHMYKIHEGLDCTALIGYALYQIFGEEYSETGYVFASGKLASSLQGVFGGEIKTPGEFKHRKAGDIMSKKGHAFIIIGECDDGSVVFLHASSPCPTIGGTETPGGNKDSKAVKLAHEYMEKYAPEAHKRYENCLRGTSYLFDYLKYTLPETVIADPEGYRSMSPEEILSDLIK